MDRDFFDFRRVRPYHWITFGYIFIWLLLISFYFSRIKYAFTLIVLHAAGLFLVLLLSGMKPRLKILQAIQLWYPALFLPLFFTVMHYLVPAIHPGNIDPALVRVDEWLTGTTSMNWVNVLNHPVLVDLMQISYSTFYFLPLLVLLPLSAQPDRKNFDRVAFGFLGAFYLSYLAYLIFPAIGPRFYLAHLYTQPLKGSALFVCINEALNSLENVQWDAFPSGHTTIALLVSYFSFRYVRKIFYFTLPVIILLILSTIFLRYHYIIDVIAGAGLFLLVVLLTRKI